MLDQTIGVFAHLEEICFFVCLYYRSSAVRAVPVDQLGLRKKGFAGVTVKAFIRSLINVALLIHFFEHFLDLFLMIIVRGADKFVIGGVHQIPDVFYLSGNVVHIGLWRYAFFGCFRLDLYAMLVSSCLKKNIISLLSSEAGDAVRQNDLICISNMRLTGCVGDRGSHIVFIISLIHFSKNASCIYIHSRLLPEDTATRLIIPHNYKYEKLNKVRSRTSIDIKGPYPEGYGLSLILFYIRISFQIRALIMFRIPDIFASFSLYSCSDISCVTKANSSVNPGMLIVSTLPKTF